MAQFIEHEFQEKAPTVPQLRKLHADIKALQEAHEQEVDRLVKESK